MEEKEYTGMVGLDVHRQVIKDLTENVYACYKRIKELSDENATLKKKLKSLGNVIIH